MSWSITGHHITAVTLEDWTAALQGLADKGEEVLFSLKADNAPGAVVFTRRKVMETPEERERRRRVAYRVTECVISKGNRLDVAAAADELLGQLNREGFELVPIRM
jgi:hypothetical protein